MRQTRSAPPPVSMTWPQYHRRECSVRVSLSPQETELLAVLLLRKGELVRYKTLIGALWPDPDTQALDTSYSLYTLIYGLRQKVAGLSITTENYRGLRLEFGAPAARA